jgi:hypothetical protein
MRIWLALLLVVNTLVQSGCVTSALLDWRRDEVLVTDAALHRKAGPAGPDGNYVIISQGGLSVKNVPTRPDGFYLIIAPSVRPEHAVVEGADGILELAPPIALSLEAPGKADNPAAIVCWKADQSEARKPFAPSEDKEKEFIACIDLRPGRIFHVQVLHGDSSRRRWVRIGTIDLGPGTQSGSRVALSYAAMPFTVAVDIVTFPVVFIGALVLMSVADSNEPTLQSTATQ